MNRRNNIKNKFLEYFLYLFFGVCTTIINIIVYYGCTHIAGINYIASNIIAWIIAVTFAYITNKFFVFKSLVLKRNKLVKEILTFFTSRLLTGAIDIVLMWFSVDILKYDDMAMKVLSNLLVIILNYLFSRLFIFNNTKGYNNEGII